MGTFHGPSEKELLSTSKEEKKREAVNTLLPLVVILSDEKVADKLCAEGAFLRAPRHLPDSTVASEFALSLQLPKAFHK